MNKTSYILGYLLIGLILIYFATSLVIEKNVGNAIETAQELIPEKFGFSYTGVDFNALSGVITVSDIKIDSIDRFTKVEVQEGGIILDWKDRYRLLVQDDFSPLQIQNLGFYFSKITMIENENVKWSLDGVQFDLNGEAKSTFLSLFQDRLPRRPFKSKIKAQNITLDPSPILNSNSEYDSFLFPISSLNIESTYDPGLSSIFSDIVISKTKSYALNATSNIVFEQNRKRVLIPSRAIFDYAFNGQFNKRPLEIGADGTQLAFNTLKLKGNMNWVNDHEDDSSLWIPKTMSSQVDLSDAILFPSTDFVRKYGIFLQTFGFEQGFAGIETFKGTVSFNDGVLHLRNGSIASSWIDANIELTTTVMEIPLASTGIREGKLQIQRISDPIRAGIRFVERQTNKKIIDTDKTITLDLVGTLGKPVVKNLFD